MPGRVAHGTHHIQPELKVEDAPAVQHRQEVDREDGWSVWGNRDVGAKENVEVH